MTEKQQDADGTQEAASAVLTEAAREAEVLVEGRAPLARRLAWIAAHVARLPKTKTAAAGGGGTFRYTPVEDMAAAITGLAAAVGVAMLPEAVDPLSEGPDWRDQEGKRTRWRYLYRVTWLVTDGREEYRVQTMGEALDYGDKASNKALTGARKYLYMMLFHLQTGEDPDAENGAADPEDRNRGGARSGQAAGSGRGRPATRSGAAPQAGGPPAAPAASSGPAEPAAPALSPEDARKMRRRYAAIVQAAAKQGADEEAAKAGMKAAGATKRSDLLDVQVWLKACEQVGLTPADPLPPDPLGEQAVAAQAARTEASS